MKKNKYIKIGVKIRIEPITHTPRWTCNFKVLKEELKIDENTAIIC